MKYFVFFFLAFNLISCGEDDRIAGDSQILENVFRGGRFEKTEAASAFSADHKAYIQDVCRSLGIKLDKITRGSSIDKTVRYSKVSCTLPIVREVEKTLRYIPGTTSFQNIANSLDGSLFSTLISPQTTNPDFKSLCESQETRFLDKTISGRIYRVDVLINSKSCLSTRGRFTDEVARSCLLFTEGELIGPAESGYIEGSENYRIVSRSSVSVITEASSGYQGFVSYQYFEDGLANCPANSRFSVTEELLILP